MCVRIVVVPNVSYRYKISLFLWREQASYGNMCCLYRPFHTIIILYSFKTNQRMYRYADIIVKDPVTSHCPKINLNLCIKTQPVMAGADATIYWFLYSVQLFTQKQNIYHCICSELWETKKNIFLLMKIFKVLHHSIFT